MDKKKITIIIIAGLALLVCITALIGVGLSRKNNVELVSIDIVEEISTAEPSTEEINSVVETTEISTKNTTEIATDQTSSLGGSGTGSATSDTNGGEGSSLQDIDEHVKVEEKEVGDTGYKVQTVSQDLFIKQEDGTYKFSEEFYTMVLQHPFFQDATVQEVSNFFNKNDYRLVGIKIGDMEMFNESLDNLYESKGQPYLKQQSSTSNSSATQNQSQQSTASNQQSTSNTPANNNPQTTEQPSTTPDSQQQQANQQTDPHRNYNDPANTIPGTFSLTRDTDLGDGGELVGNTVLNP